MCEAVFRMTFEICVSWCSGICIECAVRLACSLFGTVISVRQSESRGQRTPYIAASLKTKHVNYSTKYVTITLNGILD